MADIDRRELHTLVDHIPESDVPAARKVLRALADPVELAILAAPLDDEPETKEERASVASSLADASPDCRNARAAVAQKVLTSLQTAAVAVAYGSHHRIPDDPRPEHSIARRKPR